MLAPSLTLSEKENVKLKANRGAYRHQGLCNQERCLDFQFMDPAPFLVSLHGNEEQGAGSSRIVIPENHAILHIPAKLNAFTKRAFQELKHSLFDILTLQYHDFSLVRPRLPLPIIRLRITSQENLPQKQRYW